MIYPSPDRLDQAGSKYALVIVAAKRARQIKDGARSYVTSQSTNPLTVALEELAEGSIVPLQVGGPEKLPDTVAQGPVLQSLVAGFSPDDLDHADMVRSLLTPDGELLEGDEEIDEMGADDEDIIVPLGEEVHTAVDLADRGVIGDLDDEPAEDAEGDMADDDEVAVDLDEAEVSLDEVAEAEEAGADDDTEE